MGAGRGPGGGAGPQPGSPGGSFDPIPLTGVGGIFTRTGLLGGLVSAVNITRGVVIPGQTNLFNDQYGSTNQDVVNNLYSYLLAYQNANSGIMGNVRTLGAATIIEMANQSSLQPNNNLSTCLSALISQMNQTDQSVNACNVSADIVASPYNYGNAVGVVSVRNANGFNNEDLFNEMATAVVTNDYQSSVGLIGVEPLSIQSQQSVSDTFSWLYPAGSGVTLAVSAISALKNAGSGAQNWLNNGSFETFSASANVPDFWYVETGTPGSTILQSTSFFYDGFSSLQFVGNGSEDTSVYEPFSIAGTNYSTQAIMSPSLQFAVNLAIRMSSTPPSGVFCVALSSPSGPCSDNAGNINAFSINLNTVGTAWQLINGVFRSPNPLPGPPIYLELKLTTPLPGGYSLFIDHVAFSQMSPLYQGGPSVSFFSGNVNLVRGDTYVLSLSNDYGGKMQILFDQMYNMKSLGLLLPSNPTGGETIPDSLIMVG